MKQNQFGFPVHQARYFSEMLTYLERGNYTAPQVINFLHSAYKIPTDGQIPIAFEQILDGKDWMTNLSVKGLERRFLRTESMALVNVAASEF